MKTIRAVYENGVFRPEGPVELTPGAKVDVILADEVRANRDRLKQRFPNSFGVLTNEEADELQNAIGDEFERIDGDDWR